MTTKTPVTRSGAWMTKTREKHQGWKSTYPHSVHPQTIHRGPSRFGVLTILLMVALGVLSGLHAPASAAVTAPQMPAQFGPNDVGVIPRSPTDCPPKDYVSIYMDDEDTQNKSSMSGWTGAMSERVTNYVNGTYLNFCRVDGTPFHGLRLPAASSHPSDFAYSVLKLGAACPNGSVDYSLHIDNEDKNNQNSYSGNISPNVSNRNTDLYFCLFMPQGNLSDMVQFPVLTFTYGVLAGNHPAPGGTYGTYWKQTGVVFTNDEDTNNADTSNVGYLPTPVAQAALNTVEFAGVAHKGTRFYIARVSDEASLCQPTITSYNGAQISAPYDGANCYFRPVPSGWSPFIYKNGYYVKPHSGNQCPTGSVFDGANCYFGVAPATRSAFIWQGGFYFGQ